MRVASRRWGEQARLSWKVQSMAFWIKLLFVVIVVTGVGFITWTQRAVAVSTPTGSLYDFTVTDIDGNAVALSKYKGKVVLVVNTASQCGFTGQYKGLEELYKRQGEHGFVILGFPSNDFAGQEPGSNTDIKKFCSTKYHVTFPMFAKVRVLAGAGQAPLYAWLATTGKLPSWNFCKYLVGRDGRVIGFFPSMTGPDAKTLNDAIGKALSAKE